MSAEPDWFEKAWEQRDLFLYPCLFGTPSHAVSLIPQDMLARAGLTEPQWASCGVFRFAPAGNRPTWVYATSGLSNEWFKTQPQPDQPAGFGCEFLVETTAESEWVIKRLHHLMCFQIALGLGLHGNLALLSENSLVDLGGPIDGASSPLDHLLLLCPPNLEPTVQQIGGISRWLQLFGITRNEAEWVKSKGAPSLIERLRIQPPFPAIDPHRKPLC